MFLSWNRFGGRSTVIAMSLTMSAIGGAASAASSPAAPTTILLPTACPTDVPLTSGSIATVAGSGDPASTGDGGPALQASIYTQYAIPAVDSEGGVLFYDRRSDTIRRVAPDGTIDRYHAPEALADNAVGLAVDAQDDLYVADHHGARLWKVDPAGTATVVAGDGTRGWSGQEGPAAGTHISLTQVAVGPDGFLYFDALGAFGQVTPDGLVRTFAGTGVVGYSGDGGLATEAQLSDELEGVAVDASGVVYLGDSGNHRIRRVDTDGLITTFAGNGSSGWSGDGGPAIDATLGEPTGIVVAEDGAVIFADPDTHTVRRVGTDGVITTIAGTGVAGFSGDCGPGDAARLSAPYGVAVRDGAVFVTDEGNHRIRMLVP